MYGNQGEIQELLEDYRSELMEPDSDWPPKIRRVINCIHNHQFDRRLTVKWLKNQCHINGNNLAGKFRYYVGTTPKQYWLNHRVEAAKQILKNESLIDTPIIDIALSVGFRSHSAFSMTFKNYEGISPSKFRIDIP